MTRVVAVKQEDFLAANELMKFVLGGNEDLFYAENCHSTDGQNYHAVLGDFPDDYAQYEDYEGLLGVEGIRAYPDAAQVGAERIRLGSILVSNEAISLGSGLDDLGLIAIPSPVDTPYPEEEPPEQTVESSPTPEV